MKGLFNVCFCWREKGMQWVHLCLLTLCIQNVNKVNLAICEIFDQNVNNLGAAPFHCGTISNIVSSVLLSFTPTFDTQTRRKKKLQRVSDKKCPAHMVLGRKGARGFWMWQENQCMLLLGAMWKWKAEICPVWPSMLATAQFLSHYFIVSLSWRLCVCCVCVRQRKRDKESVCVCTHVPVTRW